VYVAGGYFRGLFAGASRYGHLGGTRRRTAAWLAMRRIERLLITQPHTHEHGGRKGAIPHLTAGLLLLSGVVAPAVRGDVAAAEEPAQGGLLGGRWGPGGPGSGSGGENAGRGEDVEVMGPCVGMGAPRRSIFVNVGLLRLLSSAICALFLAS
jgi:hypothetical protein